MSVRCCLFSVAPSDGLGHNTRDAPAWPLYPPLLVLLHLGIASTDVFRCTLAPHYCHKGNEEGVFSSWCRNRRLSTYRQSKIRTATICALLPRIEHKHTGRNQQDVSCALFPIMLDGICCPWAPRPSSSASRQLPSRGLLITGRALIIAGPGDRYGPFFRFAFCPLMMGSIGGL